MEQHVPRVPFRDSLYPITPTYIEKPEANAPSVGMLVYHVTHSDQTKH
jgi:hypothetical protein